ncbi:hypothetical protein, partial [Microcystis sp.]|uniref:hypothetical protein n=1 Tax=Microcystis sp. TaxID=1127 RepID=UPI00391A55AA
CYKCSIGKIPLTSTTGETITSAALLLLPLRRNRISSESYFGAKKNIAYSLFIKKILGRMR